MSDYLSRKRRISRGEKGKQAAPQERGVPPKRGADGETPLYFASSSLSSLDSRYKGEGDLRYRSRGNGLRDGDDEYRSRLDFPQRRDLDPGSRPRPRSRARSHSSCVSDSRSASICNAGLHRSRHGSRYAGSISGSRSTSRSSSEFESRFRSRSGSGSRSRSRSRPRSGSRSDSRCAVDYRDPRKRGGPCGREDRPSRDRRDPHCRRKKRNSHCERGRGEDGHDYASDSVHLDRGRSRYRRSVSDPDSVHAFECRGPEHDHRRGAADRRCRNGDFRRSYGRGSLRPHSGVFWRTYSPESFRRERERSREREKRRRRLQTECIKKAGGFEKLAQSEGKEPTPVFYDGFQWVAKTGSTAAMDPATMNNTRRFRRLYFGNIPLNSGMTEANFQQVIWDEMKKRGLCINPDENPVLCVWFSQKKKSYGFVEFKTVDETERALKLDGFACLGATIKVSRPNDYSQAILSKIPQEATGTPASQPADCSNIEELDLSEITEDNAFRIGRIVGKAILSLNKDKMNPPNTEDSRVMRITGLLDEQEIIANNESEYAHTKNNICKGTGELESIVSSFIVRPEDIVKLDSHLDRCNIKLNIYDVLVEFNSEQSLQRGLSNLSINKYNNVRPKTEYFDNQFYNKYLKNKN
ncbi:hypothetical protein FG386_002990 [Cryptosporidium ryanae]|uniref:uncharacterized protein n=1 Tax=Cryptosporidium ryanae TaxID=515981 RepID=UPI00351A8371|nr:hypothetical protein FG386_002990 [Cryptosporidium ryanae]